MINDYLLCFARANEGNKLLVLKIDYDIFTVKLLESIKLNNNFDHYSNIVVSNESKDHKFFLTNSEKIIMGQIQNEEITLERAKIFPNFNLYGEHLVDGKLHGFSHIHQLSLLQFCEVDLETMEKSERNAPLILENDQINVSISWVSDFKVLKFIVG